MYDYCLNNHMTNKEIFKKNIFVKSNYFKEQNILSIFKKSCKIPITTLVFALKKKKKVYICVSIVLNTYSLYFMHDSCLSDHMTKKSFKKLILKKSLKINNN